MVLLRDCDTLPTRCDMHSLTGLPRPGLSSEVRLQMEAAQAEKAAEHTAARLAASQAGDEAGQGGGEPVVAAEQQADGPQAMEVDAGQAARVEPGEKQQPDVAAADGVSVTGAGEPAVKASPAPAATTTADGAVAAPVRPCILLPSVLSCAEEVSRLWISLWMH